MSDDTAQAAAVYAKECARLREERDTLRAQLSEAQEMLADAENLIADWKPHMYCEHGRIRTYECEKCAAPVSPAAQVAPLCHHEAYQGRCIHCDAKFVGGYVELDALLAAAQQQKEGK